MVTDDDLAPLGSAAIAYHPDFPRPGWAEQHPQVWEAALGPAIDGALRAAGTAPDAVRALGIAGQLDGCLRSSTSQKSDHPIQVHARHLPSDARPPQRLPSQPARQRVGHRLPVLAFDDPHASKIRNPRLGLTLHQRIQPGPVPPLRFGKIPE